jgi:serine/threonine-protein kinase
LFLVPIAFYQYNAGMKVSSTSLSLAGPVRQKNEDSVAFWTPEDEAERRMRGAIAVMADGVGGHGNGEMASRMAVDLVLQKFKAADPAMPPKKLIREIFQEANLALYDIGSNDRKRAGMATTLSVCIFRNKQLAIGHVGDTRVYLVRHEQIKRLTHDHSHSGQQVKFRLMTEHQARGSTMRSMLTRSLGFHPIVRYDFKQIPLMKHDRVVQATDGLYCFMSDGELCEGVDRLDFNEICPYLVALAERRHTDDNLSVQLTQVDQLDEPSYQRPLSILQQTTPHTQNVINELQPGQILDGRFKIENVVNRSGMATIFKTTDLKTGGVVALKVPHMQFESDVAFFSRFEREAEIGKKLNHPNILKFYDVPEQSRPYIAMEYLEGKTLGELMNEVKPFPIEDAVQLTCRICDALAHMHGNRIVHRDLKPQNIMLCTDGTLRIMDFGIAKSSESRRLTFVGFSTTMGTPDYMAPEQVKGKRGDSRTDIYSLGAILYEMTTGCVPFDGPNPYIVMNSRVTGDPTAPRRRNHSISPELEEVILHAMERNPHYRFDSALKMKEELEDPSKVIMTGREHRLKKPKVWKTHWQGNKVVILSALFPLLVFLTALLMVKCHWVGH